MSTTVTPETLKHYLTSPISKYATNSLLDESVPFNQFIPMLRQAKRQTSFADPIPNAPLMRKPFGAITLEAIFSPKTFPCTNYAHPVENFAQLLHRYGSWAVNDVSYNNTYNENANIETYIEYDIITIVNPHSRAFDCRDLVLFSCGIGLDPRDAYTKHTMAIFDNTLNNHSDLLEWLQTSFTVGQGSFKLHNNTYRFDMTYELDYEIGILNIYDDDFNPVNENPIEVFFDFSDIDDTTAELNNAMNDIENTNDTHIRDLQIEYFCELA